MSSSISLIDSIGGESTIESAQPIWCKKMCLNGEIVDTETMFGNIWSSAFSNGLCFSETMLCRGNSPYSWREHYYNILDALKTLHLRADKFLTANQLLRRIEVLSQKNHYPPYSIIKTTIWQQQTEIHYNILQQRLAEIPYTPTLNEKLLLLPFDESPMSDTSFAWIEHPDPLHTIAHQSAIEQNYHGACLFNTHNEIVTTTIGNIYIINNMQFTGVQYQNGAHRYTICEQVEKVAQQYGYNINHAPAGLSLQMLKDAQECIVVNNTFGLKPITGIGNTIRYVKDNSTQLAIRLRKMFVLP